MIGFRPSCFVSVGLAALLSVLVGCSRAGGEAGEHEVAAAAEPGTVYTVNYPLAYFAERIGGGHFEDVTEKTDTAFGRWAWSSQFIDFDADGREDLYVSNGFISNENPDDL